ncbi:MAG TPA: gephyrin-like molybdotransferase Glp [Devosia sp.]
MSLLPVNDALAAILKRVSAPREQTILLREANGRVLRQPLIAQHDQPPFNASAMDGYAVRASDIVDGHSLRVAGVSQAGSGFSGELGPGEAVRIFTGAPVPVGADTVIMQEEAKRQGDRVQFSVEPRPGHSIRPQGSDFARGQLLLAAGTLLMPMQIALAATANANELVVAKRPRIALLATGDELVLPGDILGLDQIVASNSFGLAPLLAPYADVITDHGLVGDKKADLAARLKQILDDEPDLVVTTGGASVGDHDFVQEILVSLGVKVEFWRINMRPGKPLMFGTLGKTMIFGLPGNPVSAMVTAIVFIKPALRHLLGYNGHSSWFLPLAAPTPPNTARRHFMRAQLIQTETGPQALPILQTDSGNTSSLAKADLLIVQPEHDPGQARGTLVETIPFNLF